jgi:hypothetical protein
MADIDTRQGHYDNSGAPTSELQQLQNYFKVWANATDIARQKFRRDYEYTEGNGKQWTPADRQEVRKSKRPVLEFNQILPQVEFVSGLQRDMRLDFKLLPRSFEDVRLSEIASATLKATYDFARIHRTTDQVFDDGTICGLGVWEVLHTFDDADDLLWGDITVTRINPMAFIYDPWSIRHDMQDGTFMGKATWLDFETFKQRYPKFAHLASPGEWLPRQNTLVGASDDLGTGPNLISELWDQSTGRIRLLTMWCKKPTQIVVLVDERTGMVQEFKSKDDADAHLASLVHMAGQEAVKPFQIITLGSTATIADAQTGLPIVNPQTGAPQEFANAEVAQAHLNALSQHAGMQVFERYKVITRQAKKPYWYEMVYWQILDSGPSPFQDRNYPFVPYISRRFADDPESIMGIVRNLHDPQDEYNKRYSNLLAHLNSSSHSGWLNRKSGGANKLELELMGSKPGVVVEYATVPPQQIHPVEMSQGHFAMLQTSERNILRTSSINAEMIGMTTQQTVSGRAIKARQAGGATALKARFRSFEEAQLDLARMVFSRIQQFYPPEKIKRIIGVAELSSPLGAAGQPVFTDPVSGMPVPDDVILQYLKKVTNIDFDITFASQPYTPTEREAQFQTALQIAGLVTQSGRAIGPATFHALIDMADMPTKLATALKMDSILPPVAPPNPHAQQAIMQRQPANGDGQSIGGGNDLSTERKAEAAQERSQSTG